jgi:hypothetical protein
MGALVLAGIPALVRLLFRYRLESIRDDTVDAILDGRLQPGIPVTTFVHTIDHAMDHARLLTFARGRAVIRALRDFGITGPSEFVNSPSFCELDQDERKIMHALQDRTNRVVRSYILYGTPMAWLLAPTGMIARLVQSRGKLGRREFHRVRPEPICADLGRRHPKVGGLVPDSDRIFASR